MQTALKCLTTPVSRWWPKEKKNSLWRWENLWRHQNPCVFLLQQDAGTIAGICVSWDNFFYQNTNKNKQKTNKNKQKTNKNKQKQTCFGFYKSQFPKVSHFSEIWQACSALLLFMKTLKHPYLLKKLETFLISIKCLLAACLARIPQIMHKSNVMSLHPQFTGLLGEKLSCMPQSLNRKQRKDMAPQWGRCHKVRKRKETNLSSARGRGSSAAQSSNISCPASSVCRSSASQHTVFLFSSKIICITTHTFITHNTHLYNPYFYNPQQAKCSFVSSANRESVMNLNV